MLDGFGFNTANLIFQEMSNLDSSESEQMLSHKDGAVTIQHSNIGIKIFIFKILFANLA